MAKKKEAMPRKIGKQTLATENFGYVYAIHCEKANAVKIGVTRQSPKARMSELQTGNPFTLTLIAYHACEFVFDLERNIHQYLSKFYMEREWFEYTPEVSAFIYHNFKRLCIPSAFSSGAALGKLITFQEEIVQMMDTFYFEDADLGFGVEPLQKLE